MSDISINIDIDSNIFQDTYQYPNWFNKKKYIFYNKTLERLQSLSDLHTITSQYYDRMHYYIIGPSILITALSGIASFLSTSQMVNTDTQNAFGISVGVVASLSSVLQSISGACQFSAKKEAHRTVAEEYNKLLVALKFEIEMPNEKNFTDKLEKQILDIQNKCNYFIPQFIVDNYKKKKNKNKQINNSISGQLSNNKGDVVVNIPKNPSIYENNGSNGNGSNGNGSNGNGSNEPNGDSDDTDDESDSKNIKIKIEDNSNESNEYNSSSKICHNENTKICGKTLQKNKGTLI